MTVGTVREIKTHEYRVGLTPGCAKSYISHGHTVYVEKGAGAGSGFSDAEYTAAGAVLSENAEEVFAVCDMIVKVKEPLQQEYALLREGQILYTYLHLAANEALTHALIDQRVLSVAYETIKDTSGHLPCLRPMSEIAGRLSVQEGAKYLEKPFGGRGVLLGGIPGTSMGYVTVVGGGMVGANACRMALGLGARVTVLDNSMDRLNVLDDLFGGTVCTLYSNETNLQSALAEADLVIGAVLIPGAAAPKLIKKEHLRSMKNGAVIVDVAVDQGGCCETTHATTHEYPVYETDGVIHYCVANMPGAVPRTSTCALVNETLRYGLELADKGFNKACSENPAIAAGANTCRGALTCAGVADAFGLPYVSIQTLVS